MDAFLEKELAGGQTILPARKHIYNALAYTSYDRVNVLLVGQELCPNPWSCPWPLFLGATDRSASAPLVAKRLYRELHEDLGCRIPNNGYLTPWPDRASDPTGSSRSTETM